MSGGVDELNFSNVEDLTGKVDEVMEKFKVDEKTAREIINWAVVFAMDKMDKWVRNLRKRQKERAEEIYQLTKRLKREGKGNMLVINEIEEKILKMVVET